MGLTSPLKSECTPWAFICIQRFSLGVRRFSGIVIAPGKARRLLRGESPGRVRVSRPPVSRVGLMAERGNPRTRGGKRPPRILSAVGEIAFPPVRDQAPAPGGAMATAFAQARDTVKRR